MRAGPILLEIAPHACMYSEQTLLYKLLLLLLSPQLSHGLLTHPVAPTKDSQPLALQHLSLCDAWGRESRHRVIPHPPRPAHQRSCVGIQRHLLEAILLLRHSGCLAPTLRTQNRASNVGVLPRPILGWRGRGSRNERDVASDPQPVDRVLPHGSRAHGPLVPAQLRVSVYVCVSVRVSV